MFFLPVTSYCATETDLAAVFIEQARQKQLAKHSAWLNLLHYKSSLFSARKSQVDDKGFFLAKNGAYNAQSELEADLRGFFSHTMSDSDHPRCRFPARFHWLDTQLNFSQLSPVVECNDFNNWRETLNVEQLTLLFPAMYLENPASMFGHTFIRFDRPDNNHLLSPTLSYAASFDKSDNMLLYSWKGITGGYPGKFYLQAYFETLQKYSDIEQRDIWEYKLNLNNQEIDQLLRHLWEVKSVYFDYYFFRENCSFRLLALLDVAREKLNMSMDAHFLYAVPVDTIRDIEEAGLIATRNYRPATHNKILQMSEQVEKEARDAAFSLAKSEISIDDISQKFTENKQAKIYQLADVVLNQFAKYSVDQASLQLDILSARSHLPIKEYGFKFDFIAPESSHQSARFQLSVGQQNDDVEDELFYEIGLRPVFHDQLDATDGFSNGASISVLEAQLRWYQLQDKLKLEKLNLFSLKSIIAVNPWAMPLSRKISFQIKQRELTLDNAITEFEFQFGAGYSSEIQSVLMYALLQTQFEYATELENNHALYIGFDAGFLWPFSSSIVAGKSEIEYQLLSDVSGEEGDVQKINMGIQFDIVNDHALRFEYQRYDYELFDVKELKLSYLMYF